MLHKTEGIVLNFIKFRESSIIVKIYTKEFGVKTYIVNSIRSKNTKSRIALYQPMTFLDLVVYNKERTEINRISEAKCNYAYQTIPFDPLKTSILIFLNEILIKTIREEAPSTVLYYFIADSLKFLDETNNPFFNFHLQFLVKLASHLGFEPSVPDDILLGTGNHEDRNIAQKFLDADYSDEIVVSSTTRRNLLDAILRFYDFHIDNFGQVKSLKILKEIL